MVYSDLTRVTFNLVKIHGERVITVIFFRFSSNTHRFDPFNVIPGIETWVPEERYENYLHTGF